MEIHLNHVSGLAASRSRLFVQMWFFDVVDSIGIIITNPKKSCYLHKYWFEEQSVHKIRIIYNISYLSVTCCLILMYPGLQSQPDKRDR